MIFEKQPELQVVEECCSLASKINNADKLVSLYYLPDCLKHRLSQLLCDSQRMNAHVFKLLLQGSPTEVCVKDCSWLTEEEFTKCLQNFDPSNLMCCFGRIFFYLEEVNLSLLVWKACTIEEVNNWVVAYLQRRAFKIRPRSLGVGKGTYRSFPNLPGRKRAFSITSGLQQKQMDCHMLA
ncbi:uncharacterized protein LOC21404595 [Morus notabilis]|uniref:uncharacterized protein LOC21404595 n=1 Tax=Morus notabilis TaxID=981085 RepID=UPI000CECFCD9|nr:uncharacterized protein LOC21404595 [Morus notabilis]